MKKFLSRSLPFFPKTYSRISIIKPNNSYFFFSFHPQANIGTLGAATHFLALLTAGYYIGKNSYQIYKIKKLIAARQSAQLVIQKNMPLLGEDKNTLSPNVRKLFGNTFLSLEEYKESKLPKIEWMNLLNFTYSNHSLVQLLVDTVIEKTPTKVVVFHASEMPNNNVHGWYDADDQIIKILWERKNEYDAITLTAILIHEMIHALVADDAWKPKFQEFKAALDKDIRHSPENGAAILMKIRIEKTTKSGDYLTNKIPEELLAITFEIIVKDFLLHAGEEQFLPLLPHVSHWLNTSFRSFLQEQYWDKSAEAVNKGPSLTH